MGLVQERTEVTEHITIGRLVVITSYSIHYTKLYEVLKATGGKANPKVVNELVEQKLK